MIKYVERLIDLLHGASLIMLFAGFNGTFNAPWMASFFLNGGVRIWLMTSIGYLFLIESKSKLRMSRSKKRVQSRKTGKHKYKLSVEKKAS